MPSTTYQTRKWKLVQINDFTRKIIEAIGEDLPLNVEVCAVDSPMAAQRERANQECFFYDMEQLEAGLDKIYGAYVKVAGADMPFHDINREVHMIKKDAILMHLMKMDYDKGHWTLMIEEKQ